MPISIEPLYVTIIVLVVTKQRILLAADSRKTYLEGKKIFKTGNINKICQSGNCYYAVSGFYEEEGGFSIQDLLHRYLQQFQDFYEAIKQVVRELAPALKSYFTTLKSERPEVFQQYKRYSGAGGELFIVTRLNGIPTVAVIDYTTQDTTTIKVKVHSGTIETSAIIDNESCFWRVIGNTQSLTFSFKEKDWALYPEQMIHKIMEEGARQYLLFVSAPFRILELNAAGIRWIEHNTLDPK